MTKVTKSVTAFAVLTLFAGSSHAAPITIQNASFELPGGGNGYPQATSWSGSARTSAHASFAPSGSFPTGSTNDFFVFTIPRDGDATQTLSDKFIANTTYTFKGYGVVSTAPNTDLKFMIGYNNGGTFEELNSATYDMSLYAAWTLLDGVTYTTGSTGDELNDKQIIVRVGAVGPILDGAWFDEVSLTAVPVPEPSSLALLGLGGLCVLRRRRQA